MRSIPSVGEFRSALTGDQGNISLSALPALHACSYDAYGGGGYARKRTFDRYENPTLGYAAVCSDEEPRDPCLSASSSDDSLKCVLPGLKRVRREPSSPTSVGDVSPSSVAPTTSTTSGTSVSGPKASSTSATTTGTASSGTAAPAKMQSVVRGLQHISNCPRGCKNPLCVSTHNFVSKVTTHLTNMATNPSHDAKKCGACQLWQGIVRLHSATCTTHACAVPQCNRPII
ncbi:TPA: hypothetical protein N0F65_001921 [Lagenidium giganteum]|uniref:TAZ-type domain-containing protein n=1 Tax=Lagenidium giganteum TaxID=4803 RepID=A0AAV2Z1T7_9STRA|nr:TPA: hypothetical protein N0F65_001921 [Lagenidium giganteum]